MRALEGWLPSFMAKSAAPSRDTPDAWLSQDSDAVLVGTVPLLPDEPDGREAHQIGDVLRFDHWERVGAALIIPVGDGGWRVDGEEPEAFDAVGPPGGRAHGGFASVKALAAEQFTGQPLGVEFVKWTRGVEFRIEAGPKLAEVEWKGVKPALTIQRTLSEPREWESAEEKA